MINKIINFLFSMKMMAIEMTIFAIAIARATFIESDYGTPASKIAVYNSTWFGLLLLHLFIILIVNIINYKMYRKEKWPTFLFHIAFLIIILGAAITRFISFEGQMRVGVGKTSNVLYTSTPYFVIKANDQVNQFSYDEKRWLSEGVENPFSFDFQLPDQKEFKVDYVSYREGLIDTVVEQKKGGNNALELVVRGESKYIFQGQQGLIGGRNFSFEKKGDSLPGVKIKEEGGTLLMKSTIPFEIVDMTSLSKKDRQSGNIDSSAVSQIPADSIVPFIPFKLYKLGEESIMFKAYKKNVALKKVKSPIKDKGDDYLTIKLSTEDDSKTVDIMGGASRIMDKKYFQFGGLNFEVGYGAKPIEIPFSIQCNDFQLDKYPGSSMPSSYASEVTVIDKANGVNHDQRIFMNNFMDYGGYRFFQSSYFPDESGTILSVNYDYWGSLVTYVGYFLMGLGMLISIFNPKGRIADLNNLIKKSRVNRRKMLKTIILLIGVGLSGWSYGQGYGNQDQRSNSQKDSAALMESHSHEHEHEHSSANRKRVKPQNKKREVKYLSVEEADQLNNLLVQDYDGRIIPFNTLADKLLRKIHRSDHYKDKNAVQTIVAMHLYGAGGWNDTPFLYVSSKIRDQLGTDKYASINRLEDETGNFRWMDEYQEAYGKSDAKKNEFDKQLIKLGERYRVMKEIFQFRYFKVIPLPDDENASWVWPFSKELLEKDQKANALALNLLRSLFMVSQDSVEFNDATQYLEPLKKYQWKELRAYEAAHPEVRELTHRHVNIEIIYNKLKIFDKIQSFYFLFGFVLLILFFIRTLVKPTIRSENIIKKISYPFIGVAILVFVVHGIGLGMRWYITGHAPWSDGYEAVIFISWATVLAGLFFIRKNPAVIAVTILLAGLMLFVTQLNMLDPEITPLEPVLKSYWLMIHVAVITSSYGFLGVSAVLGFLNMFLYLFKTKNNKKRLQMNIVELTSISEMVMIIGLFMLSIGTFLGGVWANESWGRYWGWDPKEVWALVSMLVYAVIIHMRLIPKLSNRFLFNILSLWGYSAILFTFFGVNFILVGLHSYAQGEGVAEWPTGVIIAIWAFSIFTVAAIIKYLIDNKQSNNKNSIEAQL